MIDVRAALTATMVDPTDCGYCEGTGWIFLDKSYDGYAFHGGQPYVEPDDTNGGYEACGRCNSDREVEFGSGEKVRPWRRWTDTQIDEIVAALGAAAVPSGDGSITADLPLWGDRVFVASFLAHAVVDGVEGDTDACLDAHLGDPVATAGLRIGEHYYTVSIEKKIPDQWKDESR